MSVVNKMLQDLEARKAEPKFNADYQEPTPKRALPWFWLFAILVIAVAVWYGYNFYISSQTQVLQADNVPQQLSNEAIAHNMDTHSNNNVDTHSNTHPNNMDTHPNNNIDSHSVNSSVNSVKVEKNQQFAVHNQTAQAAEKIASQQNKATGRVNDRSSLPVKVKSNSTDIEPDQSSPVQRKQPMQEVFAVKTSSEVVTEAEISQQIQVALKRGDDRSVIELLDKLLTVSPSNLKARKRLAAMLFSQGEHDQANNILQKGIELQPANSELRLMQARLYVQMKNPEKAHDLLANYAVSTAQSVEFTSYRAALAQRVERFSDAQKDYLQLTQNQPANAKWWLGLAVAEERLGNNNLAMSAYRNAKQLAQLSLEVDKFVDQRIQYLAGMN